MNNKVISIINTYEKDGDFMAGVNQDTIKQTAQILKISFPNSYR